MSAQPVSASADPDARGTTLMWAVERCVDVLVECAIIDDDAVGPTATWPAWLTDGGGVVGIRGGDEGVYHGDAGVLLALSRLRSICSVRGMDEVYAAGVQRVLASVSPEAGVPKAAGLLGGSASVNAMLRAMGEQPGQLPGGVESTDLAAGSAGLLIAQVRAGGSEAEARSLLAHLQAGSRPEPLGRSWPDPLVSDADRAKDPLAGRSLCGLSHGASGVAWALCEAAAAWPGLATDALALADDALRWESAWIDPVYGGWPDLRQEISYPTMWCHGAAGAAAARLRILELMQQGLEAPWPLETVLAECEMAIRMTSDGLAASVDQAVEQGRATFPGWTLCHGLAGQASVLAYASRVLGEPRHLEAASQLAEEYLSVLPEDPGCWPSGIVGADGDLSLFNGVAGAALSLAELARPDLDLPPLCLLL